MTLITHIQNSKISVIAADSKETNTLGMERYTRKVYNFKKCILGFFGDVNSFVVWLKYKLNDSERMNISLDQIIKKGDEISNSDDRFFGLVISSFKESILKIYPKNEIYNLMEKYDSIDGWNTVLNKDIFLSPQFLGNEIDVNNNYKLHDLFNETFRKTYGTNLDIDIIKNDSNLYKLLTNFYKEIDSGTYEINKGRIGGKVNYHIIDLGKKIIEELKWGDE